MRHLFVCREFPPSPFPPGGIGAYVSHMATLLAEAGEEVHVIAQRWEGAPARLAESGNGRLIVHRVAVDQPDAPPIRGDEYQVLRAIQMSDCPSQAFSWKVSRLIDRLANAEAIDVIEAPEWEASLYDYQLRRALEESGRRRQPSCLVHLHSPSEFIFKHNDWDLRFSDYEPLCRREEYSIRAADGLICPSRYLARQVESRFGLAAGQVLVIPYPLGSPPAVQHDPQAWRSDAAWFVGRLEPRKGVLEWVDAAIRVASSHASARFEFIGSDTTATGGPGSSVLDRLKKRIPRNLRDRFRFHGGMSRDRLIQALSSAPVAVVPSRWDNLPYSCIEAMAAGLPVLASPTGGMSELVSDGESGWISPDSTATGLAVALRRFLETDPAERCRMGMNAAAAVRRICSNQSVLERHLQIREQFARGGPSRSYHMPERPTDERKPEKPPKIAVVVRGIGRPELLERCLASIRNQTRAAAIVVPPGDWERGVAGLCDAAGPALRSGLALSAVLFVNESMALKPRALEVLEAAFERLLGIDLVSCMIRIDDRRGGVEIPSTANLENSGSSAVVAIRAAALSSRKTLPAGWKSIVYPEPLVSSSRRTRPQPMNYSAMVLAQRNSLQLTLSWFAAAPLPTKARWIGSIFRTPRQITKRIMWQLCPGVSRR